MPTRLEHAEHVFGPVLRDKGVRFECELDPSLPDAIESDRQRVVQITNNLLGNAAKFTAHGQITLRMVRPELNTVFRNKDLTIDSALAISARDTEKKRDEDRWRNIRAVEIRPIKGTTALLLFILLALAARGWLRGR